MTLTELQEKLNELSVNLKIFDMVLHSEGSIVKQMLGEEGEEEIRYYVTERQVELIRGLFDVFKSLRWKVAFNNYRELIVKRLEPMHLRRCGTPVKVRSCKPEHGKKTYFGILLGEAPHAIHHSIDEQGTVTASGSYYNPAIFVPELKTIVYGFESWWGEIDSEEELAGLITDELISNVWYVKALQSLVGAAAPAAQSDSE